MLKRLRLFPDPVEGGNPTPSPAPSGTPPDPKETGHKGPLPPKVAPTDLAPPPTAKAVLEGTKTEREVTLERELESERGTRKAREQRISELEDENRTLKTPPARPAAPKKSPLTFFDDE